MEAGTRRREFIAALGGAAIGSGFAAALARPGGNITGLTSNDPALGGKWLKLLKEMGPARFS